jgi:DNA topoisomerase III
MATKSASDTAKEQVLPPLTDGEHVSVVAVRAVEKKTRPPAHYTEGALIEDMKSAGKYVSDPELRKVLRDTSGLGTSATRDSIIEVLKHHKYLETKGKNIVPTEKGTRFILWLDQVCPELTDIAQTANWEAKLDVVAAKGGGRNFEAGVAARVRELVSILKRSPAIFASPNKENSTMSDGQAPRANKPTTKQLEYAARIAQKLGKELTEEQRNSYDACSAFIEANKDAANRPTEKQVAFATRIANDKGLTVPDDVLKDGRQLSKWIDENK